MAINLFELSEKFFQQIFMVSMSVLIAILIGIPLGILAAHYAPSRKLILRCSGLFQVIPGLALLALLIPFFGIGLTTAIIALSIYALLPIINNTVVGLTTIPIEMIEAASALGFTRLQRIWRIELPLALPTLITGIRIAITLTVGTATLAAFIGAGGLGDYINRGLALNDSRLLLLGAVPAGILALILDEMISRLETRKKHSIMIIIVMILSLLLATPILYFFLFAPSKVIKIATANFTEQFILGEIMAQLIEAKSNLSVKRYFNLGTSQIEFQSLRTGQIDLYPAYTDVAFLTTLKKPYLGVPREVLYQRLKILYQQQYHLMWLTPFGFNDSQGLAVRNEFSKKHKVYSISDLLPFNHQLSIAAPPEFTERLDGMQGLQKIYGLQFATVREMTPALMYRAISDKKVDAILAFSTDGRIIRDKLILLKDDKQLFPPYDCAPLIRQAFLEKHPELKKILSMLAGSISNKIMQQLNAKVDVEHQTPAYVAKQFLLSKKLIAS